jgi:sorbitol/mannitol transport system permease protein
MTLFFSFKKYLPLRGDSMANGLDWVGFENYGRFISSSSFWPSIQATLIIVGGVLVITIVLGILLALLLDQPMWGQGIVRILVISPFFVMPTVSALVWKNMFMDPINGLLAHLYKFFGAEPVQWLSQASLESIVMIVSWQWLPFATLILLTAIQSLDSEQLEAAEMDGAPKLKQFWYIILPHMSRAITVVILIQTIFLLAVFAEIFVTTGGAFGTRTLTYLIFQRVLESQNIGLGSAGGVYAIILANIVAIFLMRIVGKNLDK